MDMGDQFKDQHAEELALENEARLQLQLDGAHVGLFEWDMVSNESSWSSGFYRMHGLEPGVSASYQTWRDQVHADDIDRVEREIASAVDHKDSVDVDYRIIQPDGQVRWTLLQARVMRDVLGSPTLMTGYCGDITRRKLADAALIESEKLAIAGRMSAALAHEINNPLAAAYNLLYLARANAIEEDQATLLDQTIEQLQRISEISQQTLRFARPTQPRLVNVADVVRSTLRLLAPKFSFSKVEPVTDLSDGCELMCSSGELQQILLNILNNVAEASRSPRSVVIRVADSYGYTGERRAGGVRITIADNGPGMTPGTLRRIREPFFTTKEGTGTGLGMWVVQELVSKMSGTMLIRSNAGAARHGTVVSLFFPTERVTQL